MPELIWSPEALADVQRLYRFLATKNLDAAKKAASAIRGNTQVLASHPHVGRPVDDMDPEFREWPINFGASGYVVLYRLHQDVALIVAVRHQKECGFPNVPL